MDGKTPKQYARRLRLVGVRTRTNGEFGGEIAKEDLKAGLSKKLILQDAQDEIGF